MTAITICTNPTDPVSQYTTAMVLRALAPDTEGPPTDAEEDAIWAKAKTDAAEARAALSHEGK